MVPNFHPSPALAAARAGVAKEPNHPGSLKIQQRAHRGIAEFFSTVEKIEFDDKGNIVSITLNQIHKLAQAFHDYWQPHSLKSEMYCILGEI